MLVLFDIGSTLLEGPSRGPGSRLAETLGVSPQLGVDISELLFQHSYSGPDELGARLAERFALPTQDAVRVVKDLWAAQIEEAYPLPGAHEALDLVEAAGHRIAFVSNIWQPFFEAFQQHFPEYAAKYRGFYSFALGVSKPNPEIFRNALDALDAQPENSVVVGDTYANDIRPSLALGMHAIWLLHRPAKEGPDIAGVINGDLPRPDLVLPSISDLAAHHIERLGTR